MRKFLWPVKCNALLVPGSFIADFLSAAG